MRLILLGVLIFICLHPVLAATPCPNGVHPIVELVDREDGTCARLFGGCINGKWVRPEIIVPKIKGRLTYRLYTATRYLGEAVGKDASLGEDNEVVQIPGVTMGRLPKDAVHVDGPIIGICGTWNAQPRKPREQKTDQPVYRQVVHDYLTRKGLATAPIYISHIQRVDLDGNGTDEVLIYASSMKDIDSLPEKEAGYYSVVLLRKIINGKVKTIPVAEGFVEHPGKDLLEFTRYTQAALLDVNGDGELEVAIGYQLSGSIYGEGITIFQITGDTVKDVLSEGGAE